MTANTIPLQNLSVGQILDRSVRLYRKHFLTFWGIVAVVYIPIGLLNGIYSNTAFDQIFGILGAMEDPAAMQEFVDQSNQNFVRTQSLAGLVTLVTGILPIFSNCAIYYATASAWMGEEVSILGAYREVKERWQSIFGTMFLFFVGYIGLMLWTFLACVIGWVTGWGMLGFFAGAVAPLAFVVVMLEQESAWQALPRAWHLARRRFWWVVGFAIALYIFRQVLILGPQSLVVGGFGFILVDEVIQGDLSEQSRMAFLVMNAVSIFMATIVLPIGSAAITLLYFTLRTEQEALDLTMQLAEGEIASPVKALAIVPRPKIDKVTPNRTELMRFGVLSIIPIILLVILFALYLALVFAIVSAMGFG